MIFILPVQWDTGKFLRECRCASSPVGYRPLAFGWAGSASPVHAAYLTGNDLVASCEKLAPLCTAYVMGLADTVQLLKKVKMLEVGVAEKVSISSGVMSGQLGRVVSKYLSEDPQNLSDPAASFVLAALLKAYPCPKWTCD